MWVVFGLSQQSCGSHRKENLAKYPIFPTSLLRLKLSWGRDNNLMIHTVIEILRKKGQVLHLSLIIIQRFLKKLESPLGFQNSQMDFFLQYFGIFQVYFSDLKLCIWNYLEWRSSKSFLCVFNIIFWKLKKTIPRILLQMMTNKMNI